MQTKELIKIAQEKVNFFNPEQLRKVGFIPKEGLYFPAIYYPPITMYPKSNEEELFRGFNYNIKYPLSVYIHIPFCPSKCLYCHWVINTGCSEIQMDCYLGRLGKEMDIYKIRFGGRAIYPKSVLIGGGTPSMFSPAQTERLFNAFESKFDLSDCSQITSEVEPSSLLGEHGMEKLKIMKSHGVSRISLGVQALDDGILKEMGRSHTSLEAIKAIEQIRLTGFESISIDLIYGYPGCTLEKWAQTLKTAFSLDIDTCQIYRLRIIPHGDKVGIIKNKFDKSPQVFPDWKEVYIMKELGILIANQSGFKETSRRVFSKGPQHNSDYLKDHCDRLYDVLGIGISAWSNIQGHLSLNTGESLEKYYSYIKRGRLPIDRGKIRTADDTRRWALVLPLKHHGVSKIKYKNITGVGVNEAFGEKINKLKSFSLLEENDKVLMLTEKGRFFADEVCIQFYHPDYLPFPKLAYAEGELNPYNV